VEEPAYGHAFALQAIVARNRLLGLEHVHVDVQEQGPGIAPELSERVFEPFFRGPDAASTAGTGIGLALAAAAARTHGGSIDILDSDRGAHLRATLPLDRPD